jgi:hypothetical protein
MFRALVLTGLLLVAASTGCKSYCEKHYPCQAQYPAGYAPAPAYAPAPVYCQPQPACCPCAPAQYQPQYQPTGAAPQYQRTYGTTPACTCQ